MLKNLDSVIPSVIIEAFQESEHTFHLTGSRFWGNARNNSDWDFFVDSDERVANMLEGLGFKRVSEAYTDDAQCTSVYEKFVVHANGMNHTLIQVQLVASAELKNTIQNKLFELYPQGLGSKSEAKVIWNQAFEFFCLGRDAHKG